MNIWLGLGEFTSHSLSLKGLIMDGQETWCQEPWGRSTEGHTPGVKSCLLPFLLSVSAFKDGKPTVKPLCTQLGKMFFSSRDMSSPLGRCNK